MARVSVEHLGAARDGVAILHDVSFSVEDGEAVAIVGPSGSGKSTLLRAIAGLDEVTAGRVVIGARDVTRLPTRDRDLAMVFQSARLQPHLDVGEFVGFPLDVRGVAEDERDRRVEAEARAFSIRRLLRRRPNEISAGERHAASLAHSLVRPPAALLLDEPVSQLDSHARRDALRQIATLQSGYGMTLLVATNDESDAATLASRLVLLRDGRVRQIAPYGDLYERPADTFVAQYVGSPPMNLLRGVAWRTGSGGTSVTVAGAEFDVTAAFTGRPTDGAPVTIGVRPEHLDLVGAGERGVARALTGVVEHRGFLGPDVHTSVTTEDGQRIVAVLPAPAPTVGARVRLRARHLHVFDAAGTALVHRTT